MMALLASTALAAPPMEGRGSAERGALLTQRWCASCHVTDGQGTDAVPSLAKLARTNSAAALRIFLTKPHGGMPDPGLETQGIEDVIAYMESLK